MALWTLLLSWSKCNHDLINDWETILGISSLLTVSVEPSASSQRLSRNHLSNVYDTHHFKQFYCLRACQAQFSAKSCTNSTTCLVKSLVENPKHGICRLQLSAEH